MQGGYVSQSQGQQLNVTKKSNVLNKSKPNALNSAAKKLQNHDSSNNNNNDADINDSASNKTSHYERDPSPPPAVAPAPVVPEVTVSF